MGALPSGSYLMVTHPTYELSGDVNRTAMEYWNKHSRPPIRARSSGEIRHHINGLELIDPGLVSCSLWRNKTTDGAMPPQYAALAGKA